MTELEFWRRRLLMLLHDPPHKLLLMGSGLSHEASARAIAGALAGKEIKGFWRKEADWLATGADRPLLGGSELCKVDWRKAPLFVHPLQPEVAMALPAGERLRGKGAQARARELEAQLIAWWGQGETEGADPGSAETALSALPLWTDAAALQRLCLRIWRASPRWVEEELELPAELLPADSRIPDHGILSHLRMAGAFSFLQGHQHSDEGKATEPVLLCLRLHGVQDFIAESRKLSDMWTASMIYGELVWAMIEPILQHYGPEQVLYPDLRGNPYMDQRLLDSEDAGLRAAVPQERHLSGARIASVPLPHSIICALPRGGEGHLLPLAELVARCERSLGRRWQELCDAVRDWLDGKVGAGPWMGIYQRATLHPPQLSWTALAWPNHLRELGPATAEDLPFLPGRKEAGASEAPALQRRRAELQPLLSRRAWEQSEHARHVAWQVDRHQGTQWLSRERGFDYPLVHAALLGFQEQSGLARQPDFAAEPGDKCALTGRHETLHNGTERGLAKDKARQSSRRFWRAVYPKSGGTEHLGGIGALKRLLGQSAEPTFRRRWLGPGAPSSEDKVPFPSTATLAAAPFLVKVAARGAEKARDLLEAVQGSGLEMLDSHTRSLPHLIPFAGPTGLGRLAELDGQALSIDVLRTELQRQEEGAEDSPHIRPEKLREAIDAALALRREMGEEPGEEVAILRMDGDGVSGLLKGSPERMPTRWEDVLHPQVLEQIRDQGRPLGQLGWRGLLKEPRHISPSLQATITRSLALFTDLIAPHVVEVEFHGRLIYAGGDDVMAILPAPEALACAARLQQLYSAPFVVDTRPQDGRWEWRQEGQRGPIDEEERRSARFQIPEASDHMELEGWPAERPIGWEESDRRTSVPARVIWPMMGRHCALSAGISIGHFKTPLQSLILSAGQALDAHAKAASKLARARGRGGGHVCIMRHTGQGAKERCTLPWRLDAGPEGPPDLSVVAFDRVQRAFKEGALAARSPYRLLPALETLLLASAGLAAEVGPQPRSAESGALRGQRPRPQSDPSSPTAPPPPSAEAPRPDSRNSGQTRLDPQHLADLIAAQLEGPLPDGLLNDVVALVRSALEASGAAAKDPPPGEGIALDWRPARGAVGGVEGAPKREARLRRSQALLRDQPEQIAREALSPLLIARHLAGSGHD